MTGNLNPRSIVIIVRVFLLAPKNKCQAFVPEADGLLPGTLFDAIDFDHENDFVVLVPEAIVRTV